MNMTIDNRFELDSGQALAEDAMFQIYKAHDKEYGRQVIIKILRNEYSHDASIVHKFQEYSVDFQTKVRNKKNLAEVSQISGVAGGTVYMVQEYIDGLSLHNFLESKPNTGTKDFISILGQICEGLHCLHHSKLCHYEVLPRNILITDSQEVKLVGLGSLYSVLGNVGLINKLTADVEHFIAPEIRDGKSKEDISSACDIYAVGKILEILPIVKNEEMSNIISKATEKEPIKRYQKIREFMTAVEAVLAKEPEVREEQIEPSDNPEVKILKMPEELIDIQKEFRFQLPIKKELASSISDIIIENQPPTALFVKDKQELHFSPLLIQAGQYYQIRFKILYATDQEIIELPIRVNKPKPKVKEVQQPIESEKREIIKPEWEITPPRSFSVNEIIRFVINNPDRTRFKIHLKSRPPAAKTAEFDEATGEFRWNLKKEAGSHIFEFDVIAIDNPNASWTKQMTLVVDAAVPDSPQPESDSASQWKVYAKSFLWIYNLIFFVAGFFGVVLFVRDILVGFILVMILEGIYLVASVHSEKFQGILKSDKQ